MHPIDLGVLGLWLLGIVGLGYLATSSEADDEDLFLAGRSLRWPAIGLSLFASNISSTTLVGLAGAAYVSGIAVSAYEWMAGVVLLVAGATVLPAFLRTEITTVPTWLSLRFGDGLRRYFSGLTILLSVLVDTAGGLYAGALVLQTLLPWLPLTPTIVAMAVFAGLYTAAGGLRAVVYTDVAQAIVLLLGCAALTGIAFVRLDGSVAEVLASLPDGHLSLVRPMSDPELPWLGLITGVPILGFWYWAANQYITQRLLAARGLADARWGAMLGGWMKLLPLLVMVLPGVLAVRLLPGLEEPDQVLPTMILELLPIGLTGLVLAALVSAILSSVDSTLNAASALVVHDFLDEGGGSARTGRITTLTLMVVAALWAPWIGSFRGLFAYLQQSFAIFAPPVVVVFLGGVLWSQGTRQGAFAAMIGGHLAGLGLFIANQLGWWPLHFTITAGVSLLIATALFVLVSLATTSPVPDARSLWRPGDADADARGLGDWRVQGAGLVAVIAGMVWVLW